MAEPVHLMILPGLDGTEVLFRPFVATLPKWVRPTTVCYPPEGPNDYPGVLALVRRKAAELPGPFYVLATSFSGPLATMLAAEEPTRVRGTVLVATFLRAPTAWLSRLGFAVVGPLFGAVRTIRRLPVWALHRDDPYRLAKAEIWRRVSARCLAERTRAIAGVDVRGLFRQGSGPVLCVAFAEDKVVPRRNALEIARSRPGVTLVTTPGDHFAMWKKPLPLAEAVLGFLRQTEGR